MHKSISFYTIVLASFLTFALFSSYTIGQKKKTSQQAIPTAKVNSSDNLPQVITGIDLNQTYTFAGERLPTENFDVKERLDRELLVNSYRHSATIQYIKLANRYLPTISNILAANGIPDDFKYLAIAESGLRNVGSPAGARGIWQFMKGTGLEYGLDIATQVDERHHLEKSTQAACKYLKRLYDRFGSWTLAAAAYNMGGSNLNKEMTTQREKSYYDLNLNKETSRYVFRIMAYKEIISNPTKFGFQVESSHLYPPLTDFVNIQVNTSVANWGDWAKQNGITYRMLKVYNPWLTSSSLSNKRGKEYLVKVPRR